MVAASKLWVPERQDVIWIQFNPQVSPTEMRDEHPMLVLSTKAFNERTGLVIGLPMTHAASNETNPFAVKHVGPSRRRSRLHVLHLINPKTLRLDGISLGSAASPREAILGEQSAAMHARSLRRRFAP